MSEDHKNLSETLFKKHKQAKETSRLTQYMPSSVTFLDEKKQQEHYSWYRNLRRYQWIWQGIDPIEQEEVLARIASSEHSRTEDEWLDTVIGYRPGNWAYEWTNVGMQHQKKAAELSGDEAAEEFFTASLCFSIAGYPHLRGDNLAIQAQVLATSAYEEAMKASRYITRQINVPYQGKNIQANLHLPHTERQLPLVIVSAGLDTLQTDLWRIFRDYLAEKEIAMLTVDMPSVGSSSHWQLTEDSCKLHKAVLDELPHLPWVDHHKVGLLGYRFGGNAMLRLSFMEQNRIKACVALGAPIHDVFSSPAKVKAMSKMYLDVLASRLGKTAVDINSLAGQMMAWSLKVQGFLTSKRTKVPILAMALEGDPVSPLSDNRLAAMFSHYGKAKQISAKSISSGYEQSLDLAIKWLEDELI
ncbi:esterase FrsA [Vibrio sp. SCSIO 43137]|uniref:esterase FrsA n=1 Tax=Vibrio sp. SCSIO 43137 TaxID=3021011 RepID=UPI002307462D|nr:esterase FrsA [Vibrio sp. SCSIO 43137]WCE30374.1 esterase FrsA [Vibrio sp. SCSIO 43137]